LDETANWRKPLQVTAVQPDYYEVLGVPHDADEETIRRGFHALASDCHPDVSDELEDQRRFRELAEAYAVLSRPASRLLYDRYGYRVRLLYDRYDYRGRGNQRFDADDGESDRFQRGEDVHARIELRASEARNGTTRLMSYDAPTLCTVCDGRGVIGEADPECRDCDGTGQIREIPRVATARILRSEACSACGVEPCDECEGTGMVEAERRLHVGIPAGVEDGDQVLVAGEGGEAGADGVPGDLLVDISVVSAADGSTLVRYLAFAGALAAASLLIAYLLIG
jgi:molecular chaperone DnaJ